MLAKSIALVTINHSPEKFLMNDLFEKMYVIEKIENGLVQSKNNQTISESELDEEIKKWFGSEASTIKELSNRKVPIVRIDSSLEKFRNKVLFPEKLAKANEMLKTAKLPTRKHHS